MYRIGIDLGGTNTAAGLVDDSLKIIDKISVPTVLPTDPDSLTDGMAMLVRQLLSRNQLSAKEIHCIGVGVPCTANEENGCMEDAAHLGFESGAFLEPLRKKTGIPVFFGNDANAAALGEYSTGGYDQDSLIMVTLGTGIGGGIILNGKLWSGINYAAAEFGHMTIRTDGVPCICGRRGCFETYGSGYALIRRTRECMETDRDSLLWQLCGGNPDKVEAKTLFDGAKAGDTAALQILDGYTTDLADGLANIINIFQPAVLCIGGGISKAGDILLQPLRKKTALRICTKNAKRNTQIILARADNDAGIIGAALLGN